MRNIVFIIVPFFALCPSSLIASETITMEYDLLGRLIGTSYTGSVNNGLATRYTVDDAGNRKRVLITGSSNQGTTGDGVIVVPLNGLTVIPIGQ